MKRIPKKWLIIGAIVILAPLVLELTGLFAYGKWRYEMTVVVETPEGIKQGSAVRQVSNSASSIKILDLPEAGNPASFKGESVVVDLGERGLLFTLLEGPPLFYNAFRGSSSGATTVRGIRELNGVPAGKEIILEKEEYPWMVAFKDIHDPKSIQKVYWREAIKGKNNPYVVRNNLEEFFGEDTRIKEIRLKKTRMPVTSNIDKYLNQDFWNKCKKWRSDAKEEWKETVGKAGGLHNLSEVEKNKLFEKTNQANFISKNKFKQGEK